MEQLDPETATLREAWLALGEILEAAQPRQPVEIRHRRETPRHCNGEAVQGAASRKQLRWSRLLAGAALAASLLVVATVIWAIGGGNRQTDPGQSPQQMAAKSHRNPPSQKTIAKSVPPADVPQWDDSFDEQFAQLSWQMLCVQESQVFRTDAFGQAQYRLEQLRETIQADSL